MKFLWIIPFFILTTAVFAQTQNDPKTGHTHEGDVGEFYMTWRRPLERNSDGMRIYGCCGNADCRPVLEMRRRPNGMIDVLAYEPYTLKPYWYSVASAVWEDNQPDPRESPDERSHVCIVNGRVICAVRTSGQ